jgi:hypothetical protein
MRAYSCVNLPLSLPPAQECALARHRWICDLAELMILNGLRVERNIACLYHYGTNNSCVGRILAVVVTRTQYGHTDVGCASILYVFKRQFVLIIGFVKM